MRELFTKVSEQGNIIEVTTMLRKNGEAHIVKLNADEYVRLDDGEILEFQHSESRADLKQSLYRTFRTIRALVNANCTEPEKVRWITLTYAENMQDRERLYKDFKKFIQRFRWRWGSCEYIVVAEPQARGAWHMHALVFFPEKAPYIPNAELRECWGHGFVNVKSVKDVDNVGAYLSAYLGDIEVSMSSKDGVVKKFPDGTKKKFKKGGRLHLYPPGMNIYRCSRGVKRPKEYWAEAEQKEALTRSLEPTYANRYEFINEQGFHQIVQKEYYNRLRDRAKEHG